MKTEALKPLGEEKPTVITDTHTKIHDTLVDVPLPDSEPKTKTKTTKTKTKTKADQPSADSAQNIQDHKHCRAGSIKDGQFASKQATSLPLTTNRPKPARQPRALLPHALLTPFGCLHACVPTATAYSR